MPKATRGKPARRKTARARCRTCGQAIRIPKGWSIGAASRRHYWAKHPEIMRGEGAR